MSVCFSAETKLYFMALLGFYYYLVWSDYLSLHVKNLPLHVNSFGMKAQKNDMTGNYDEDGLDPFRDSETNTNATKRTQVPPASLSRAVTIGPIRLPSLVVTTLDVYHPLCWDGLYSNACHASIVSALYFLGYVFKLLGLIAVECY